MDYTKEINKYYYLKATALRRLSTRFLDLIILTVVGLFINFVLNLSSIGNWKKYINSIINSNSDINQIYTQPKILTALPIAFAAIIPILYFVGIAYCMNCQTVGKKISGIKIIDSTTLQKPTVKQLFKHEFFISVLPSLCLFAFFIYYVSNKDFTNPLTIFQKNSSIGRTTFWIEKTFAVLIGSLYGLSYTIILFILIFLLLSKKKLAFHDLLSKTRTVSNNKYYIKKTPSTPPVNSNPLEIFRNQQLKSK